MKKITLLLICFFSAQIYAQFNFAYNFNTTGRRVCLVNATATESPAAITLHLLENIFNTAETYTIKRRPINGSAADWTTVASGLLNASWTDNNVSIGTVYEYQVSRTTTSGVATGYVTACLRYDQTNYKGQMILVIDNSFQNSLSPEILQLKQDLTYEGWLVNEIYAPRATTWATEPAIITLKNNIAAIYNNAPANDKPTHLFLLGHLPIARSGLGAVAPDDHDQNKGARGADCFYADIDGIFTDTATFNPGNINPLAVNLPGDLKWDQDFIPSALEMAFGRVDFADLTGVTQSEENLLRSYLNRLHSYRTVASGFDMGNKTAFNNGYANSTDGSYRSLIPISGAANVDYYSGTLPYPQWVAQNGPYQIFMQNVQAPDSAQWQTYGMESTIFSSDQSYWGYWDEPLSFNYGKIRELLSKNTKCLGMVYTTTAINIFHQPGMGETMGWSCKRIMDHNLTDNLYQKPEQPYDTNQFWNRTHFQYHGDPTLRLNQVKPPTNVQVSLSGGHMISWTASADTDIVGYHVYKSYTEFGPFLRMTTTPITALSFTDMDIAAVVRHYIVKAVKLETTGSGTYLNPSIGVLATPALHNATFGNSTFGIYPNPANDWVYIETSMEIAQTTLFDLQGKNLRKIIGDVRSIPLEGLETGVYLLRIESTDGQSKTEKLLKL